MPTQVAPEAGIYEKLMTADSQSYFSILFAYGLNSYGASLLYCNNQ